MDYLIKDQFIIYLVILVAGLIKQVFWKNKKIKYIINKHSNLCMQNFIILQVLLLIHTKFIDFINQ